MCENLPENAILAILTFIASETPFEPFKKALKSFKISFTTFVFHVVVVGTLCLKLLLKLE